MSLEAAFKTYTDLVQAVISAGKRDATTTGTMKPSTYDVLNLRSLIEDLESQAEFRALINETALTFSKEPYKEKPLEYSLWKGNTEAFFRRSGFYLSAHNGEIQDANGAFGRYVEAFKKEKVLRRYLVPLEFVDFDDGQIDFGSFRIFQPTRNEL